MKKTVLWSALFAMLCIETQADTTPQPAATTPVNTSSSTTTQSTQPTATPPTDQPVAQQPTTTPPVPTAASPTPTTVSTSPTTTPISTSINCDYKIAPNTKAIEPSLILSWSQNATAQAFDFNPKSLDGQLKMLQNCFTEQGWMGFNTALQKSGNVEAIKTQNLTVSSQVDGNAQITDTKDNQWKVNLPLQVVYQNDKEKVTQLLTVQLTVGRKVNGDLGIAQLIATPRQATPVESTDTKPSSDTAVATTPTPDNSTTATTPEPASSEPTSPTATDADTKSDEQTPTPTTTAPTH
jgi:hypothetical protein